MRRDARFVQLATAGLWLAYYLLATASSCSTMRIVLVDFSGYCPAPDRVVANIIALKLLYKNKVCIIFPPQRNLLLFRMKRSSNARCFFFWIKNSGRPGHRIPNPPLNKYSRLSSLHNEYCVPGIYVLLRSIL